MRGNTFAAIWKTVFLLALALRPARMTSIWASWPTFSCTPAVRCSRHYPSPWAPQNARKGTSSPVAASGLFQIRIASFGPNDFAAMASILVVAAAAVVLNVVAFGIASDANVVGADEIVHWQP